MMGRVDWQQPATGGTGPTMGGGEYSRRREGNRKNERHFFPGVTLHSHPHWLVPPEGWWVSGQEL